MEMGKIQPIPPSSLLIGKLTRHGSSGEALHYALSLPREGPAAGLNAGDRVQMGVVIKSPAGIPYYEGPLEGTVAHVSKNRVKIYLYAAYKPVIELAYREKLPVLVHIIVKTRRRRE